MQRRANTTGVQFLQPSTVRWIVRAIEAQILDRVASERERCAKIVDMPPGTEAWEVIGGEEGLTMLRELAAQIRSGASHEQP